MKKLFTLIGVLALALTTQAQNHLNNTIHTVDKGGFEFLTVPAIYVTNTLAVTNLSLASSLGTNVAGVAYTNAAGTRSIVTATAGGTNFNLLRQVPLSAPMFTLGPLTNSLTTTDYRSPMNVSVKFAGGSGANAAVRFTLTPSWDGVTADSSGAFDWTFAFTATTSTTLASATNAPTWLWQGAKSLVLSRVVNADTDASSQVIVTSVRLNGPTTP